MRTDAGQLRPEQAVLEKFTQRGFEKLTLEELALTQASAAWKEEFEKATGENWEVYQSKAAERLKRANFDMKWLVKRTDNIHTPLLTAVIRGDVSRVNEYMRLNDLKTCIGALDDTRKTCLHLAAQEGHSELVTLFLTKGWPVDVKDRLHNTPLHLACYRGHANVVQILLRKQANPMLGDTAGRKAIHYACSALTSEALLALLNFNRSVLSSTDNTGRGPFHYLVHNTSPNGAELLRTLLGAGGSVDQRDSEGRTALHYACEAGKTKWVSVLLKSGAGLNVKDNAGKTPVDLAKSDQVHQLVSTYVHPAPPLTPPPSHPRSLTPPNPSRPANVSQKRLSRRDLLYSLLKRVQEAGVTGKQHSKHPDLFTGAWLDGISTPQGLLSSLSSFSSAETALRVFNILFPYSKEMPVSEGDEGGAMGFYGEIWSNPPEVILIDPGEPVKPPEPQEKYTPVNRQHEGKIKELEERVRELEKEGFGLRKELNFAERKAKDLEKMVPLQDQLRSMEGERDQAFIIKEKLQREVISLRQQLDTLKTSHTALNSQLKSAPTPSQIQDLEKIVSEKDAKDRALRAKAGILFLKSLDQREEAKPAKGEAVLQDGQVIDRLNTAVIASKQDLSKLLDSVDSNADGRITKSELTKALDKLEITPQDILALMRIAGFRPGVNAVPISSLVKVVLGWERRKEVMIGQLFTRLKGRFADKPLEEIFQALDVNGDGTISFAEFTEATNSLKLGFSREERHAVFAVLDQDHSGTISLEDMKAEIEKAEDAPPTPPPEEPSFTSEPDSPKAPVLPTKPPVSPAKPQSKPSNQTKSENKKLSGRLYVQIVKGKNIGQGKVYAVGKLAGAEGEVRTDVLEGPMPMWKGKGRFKIEGEAGSLGDCIQLEIRTPNVTLSTCSIPWLSAVSQPSAWAVNSDFALKDKTGKDRGVVTVQLKWVPKDSWQLQASGTLRIQPLTVTTGADVLVAVGVGKGPVLTSKTGPPWKDTLQFPPLILSLPLPPLSLQIVDFSTQTLVASATCSLEPILSCTKPEGQDIRIDMGSGVILSLKASWKPMTKLELLQFKYATKIQARWRGHKARISIPKASSRRLVSRKGAVAGGKYYLLDVYEDKEEDNVVAELHFVSNPAQPMYEIVDKKDIELSENVDVSETGTIISSGNRLFPLPAHQVEKKDIKVRGVEGPSTGEIAGDLGVKVISAEGVEGVMLRCVVGKVFAYSLEGPPWGRPVALVGVRGDTKLEISVLDVATRKERARGQGDFKLCLSTPHNWSSPVSFPLSPSGSLALQYQWQPYEASKAAEDEAASKLQAIWKGKQTREDTEITKKKNREVIERRGVKDTDGKYYLISFLKDVEGGYTAELNPIADRKLPLFTVLDSKPYDPSISLDAITVSQGLLKIGDIPQSQPAAKPSDSAEEKGDLGIKITGIKGVTNVMLRITSYSAFVHSLAGPPWPRPLLLSGAGCYGNKVALDVTIMDVASRKDISTQSIQVPVPTGEPGVWSGTTTVRFKDSVAVEMQFQWIAYPKSQKQEEEAASKLQAMWKGKQTREDAEITKKKHREVVERRGVKDTDGKYYLISFLKGEGGYTAELHPIADTAVPVYTVLDSRPYDPSINLDDVTVIGGQIQIKGNTPPPSKPNQSNSASEKGDLAIKVTGAKGLNSVMLKAASGTVFATSLAGPPWPRPILLTGVTACANKVKYDLTVVELSTQKDLHTQSIPASIDIIEGNWSSVTTVKYAEMVWLEVQYQWLPYPANKQKEEEAAVKVQTAWRGKVARQEAALTRTHREVLSRMGLKGPKNRLYLVSLYKEDSGAVGVGLNRVSDPRQPMYEELDYVKTNGEVEEISQRVEITEAEKIRLK